MFKLERLLRGGAVVARQAHNLKAVGSIPAPATNEIQELTIRKFLFLCLISRFTAETARFFTLPLLF